MSRMSEYVGASTSRNPKGLHVLYGDNFTFLHHLPSFGILPVCYQLSTKGALLGVKMTTPPLSSVKAKIAYSYTSTLPYIFINFTSAQVSFLSDECIKVKLHAFLP
jgi:hypothetical protein